MADVTLRATEKRYVRFAVTADTDPLADPVTVAFTPFGVEPATGDFHSAQWEIGQTWSAGTEVWARIQVGPTTAVVLAPGVYRMRARIVDVAELVDLDVGTLRIRAAAALNAANLRAIRGEIGNSSPPTDGDLDDLWTELGSVPAVALAILRPRMADALTAAAAGSLTIPGALGVVAPAQPTLLAAQISRLEGQLAAESGVVDESGLGATSVLVGRTDRPR